MKQLIKHIPLFSGLSEQELDAVAAIATTRKVTKNCMIVQEGERGDSLFIVVEGGVKISTYSYDGREVVLSLLEPGAFFGEMALLDQQPRSANVTALEATTILQIQRKHIADLLLKLPALTLKLLTEVVERLRRTSQILERISSMDVPHRLYSYLKDYCHRFGNKKDNDCTVRLPTHQLMADQLSTSRETISRAMSSLKKEGIIQNTGNSREVCVDMEAIETLLQAIQ